MNQNMKEMDVTDETVRENGKGRHAAPPPILPWYRNFCSAFSGQRAKRLFKIHTYHLHFIPEGVAEATQMFLRDAHDLPKLPNTADVTGGKPIAI
jgi:hypothetical protein